MLLNKAKEDLLESGDHKPVNISSSVLPTVPVVGFPFEQLFTNLLSIAIKFSKKDEPANINITASVAEGTTIEHEHVSRESQYHRLCFSDNGIGFDPQFTDRIFLVFQWLHPK